MNSNIKKNTAINIAGIFESRQFKVVLNSVDELRKNWTPQHSEQVN